jgi:hypothetical protein
MLLYYVPDYVTMLCYCIMLLIMLLCYGTVLCYWLCYCIMLMIMLLYYVTDCVTVLCSWLCYCVMLLYYVTDYVTVLCYCIMLLIMLLYCIPDYVTVLCYCVMLLCYVTRAPFECECKADSLFWIFVIYASVSVSVTHTQLNCPQFSLDSTLYVLHVSTHSFFRRSSCQQWHCSALTIKHRIKYCIWHKAWYCTPTLSLSVSSCPR